MQVQPAAADSDFFRSLLFESVSAHSTPLEATPRQLASLFLLWRDAIEAGSNCPVTSPCSSPRLTRYLRDTAKHGLTVLYAAMQKRGRPCSVSTLLELLSAADNLYALESGLPACKTRLQLELFLDLFRARSHSSQGLRLDVLQQVLLGPLAEILQP